MIHGAFLILNAINQPVLEYPCANNSKCTTKQCQVATLHFPFTQPKP